MRSLRIFYSDDACTSGQLVIASRESQYKILHFHHGGLDRLVETFSGWKFLAQPKRKVKDSSASDGLSYAIEYSSCLRCASCLTM
jgi:TBC1 domain family member 16